MSAPTDLVTLDFHGDLLMAHEQDGTVFVALRPIVDAIGLNWSGQFLRVQRDPILCEGICIMQIPTAGGKQDALALRMDLLNGWLFTIDASRIKDERTRDRVLMYQRECYQVLFAHFHGERDRQSRNSDLSLPQKLRLVSETRRLVGPQPAKELWTELGLPVTASFFDAKPDVGRRRKRSGTANQAQTPEDRVRRVLTRRRGWVRFREVLRSMATARADDLRALLQRLVDAGEIEARKVPPPPRGGHATSEYRLR